MELYDLSDLLLFSRQNYLAMLADYNQAVFPAQPLFAALLVLLVSPWIPAAYRIMVTLKVMAACWLWVGIGFYLLWFSSINWAAYGFALLFALQAVLMIIAGFRSAPGKPVLMARALSHLGLALVLFGVLIQPFLATAGGSFWLHGQYFGVTPYATITATFGLLLLLGKLSVFSLSGIPLLCCLLSAITLKPLSMIEGWTMALVLFVTAIGLLLEWRQRQHLHPRHQSSPSPPGE